MSLEVDEHRELLVDETRIAAFRAALGEVVHPDTIVADIGTGSGVLGMLACQAGAARVYSIEAGAMIQVARTVSRANGFEGRQIFIRGMSTEIALPEKADVAVADQIGHFGCEAGVFEYFADARDRHLKPGGVFMPSRIDLHVAPVEAPEVLDHLQFWRREPAGLDFGPAHDWSSNTGYPERLDADQLLGAPERIFSVLMSDVSLGMYTGAVTLTVERPGTLHGVGGWFHAQLSPGVTLTNAPTAIDRIRRRNAVFPVDRAVPVAAGDEVRVVMRLRAPDSLINWQVEVWSARAGRPLERTAAFRHSTFKGMLFAREDLARMKPDFVPVLTERGEARMTVLSLCDGTRPLSEVEREVHRGHPGLFPTFGEAAAFVAEVVTRYTRDPA